MPILIDHLPLNLNVGQTIFGPATVNDSWTTLTCRFSRQTAATPTLWGAGVQIVLRAQQTVDAGATWRTIAGFTSVGGISVFHGAEVAQSVLVCNLPQGTNRRIRAVVDVTGGTFVSETTIESQ